ncbi:MAG: DUF362 domain-containing protein [Candidatus Omnitrophica bacterium]|nr:DUF362 domain-containing protein [Candidatus Omnitrophota bacterium]
MKSDVYFIKTGPCSKEERGAALEKVLKNASSLLSYKKDEIVPIKVTIGDSTCVYHLNPELVKSVVNKIKKSGAKPFLFDTSVIYKGQRQNAVDHMSLAQSKGFGQTKTGAPFLVADGLLGQDGKELPVNSENINKIRVPSFVGMLDSLIVLSHPTGHIVSGFAAAIKNVAMGMSCRATKQVQHSSLKPSVIEKKCTACGLCIDICPVQAISFKENKALIDQKACIGCGECLCACKFDAIFINWHEDPVVFCKRMVEVAGFILSKFKNKFFINFAFDITKECDCISNKDEKMISKDIGILASEDILSLDKATSDLACRDKKTDYLKDKQPVYGPMFDYAAEKGLGNIEYNLIEL